MKQTTFDEFVELSRQGTFVPVCREIMADLLTPVSAFLKVAEQAKHAFLFESGEGGEQIARYSFLGKDPFLLVHSRGGATIVEELGVEHRRDEPFVTVLGELMTQFTAPPVPGLPRFIGGAVGYFDYDAAEWFEPTVALDKPPLDRDQASFMVFDTVLAFDHVKHRILAIANARLGPRSNLKAAYDLASAKVAVLESELERNLQRSARSAPSALDIRPNQTKEAFETSVRSIQEDIAAGEIYQAVLSQRFDATSAAPPFDVYRALRHINPSPYMFFIRMGREAIVGASPEMLVRVEGKRVETHPIAGTRRRGATDDEDRRLAAELLANEKERAEHVMLVDLGRNDVGRVAAIGTVTVKEYMAIERYSHVMHMVSHVIGKLRPDVTTYDALRAYFPHGTVTGAPKIRTMEIIAELEGEQRGGYGGCVGYFDMSGNCDTALAIRTIWMRPGEAFVQAAGGVVYDSTPEEEYMESGNKARAMMRAIDLAEERQEATPKGSLGY